MVRHYCSMVDKVLGLKNYFDINTVHQLHGKLRVPIGRLRNEVNPAAGLHDRVSHFRTEVNKEDDESGNFVLLSSMLTWEPEL